MSVSTTISTLAGLQERYQADANAMFQYSSRLWKACWAVEAINAGVVQFPVIPAPSAVSEQTEGNDVTPTAVSVGAAPATLGAFVKVARASKISLQGGAQSLDVLVKTLVNDIGASVDKHIASKALSTSFSGWTTDYVADVVTVAAFASAIAQLRDSGYSGKMKCFMTESMGLAIGAAAGALFTLEKNNEIFSSGYLTTYLGVEIYTISSALVTSENIGGTTKQNGLIWYDGLGLGLGYYPSPGGGLVHITMKEDHNNIEVGATAYVKATALSTTGGLVIRNNV